MEHRDRLARFGFDLLEAALAASGRHVVVIEDGEVTDDLVQDVLEILTSACMGVGRQSEAGAGGNGMRVITLRAGSQPGGPDRPGEARGCRPPRLQLGPGSLSGGQRTRRADPLSGGPPQGLERVEAKERPLVGGGVQMRPSGGIPGSGAGRPQLAEGPGQLPPRQAQSGQQGEVNPGHASLASARSAPRSGRINSWSSFSPGRHASSRRPSPERRIAGS